jgi:succinyl-diaminopimelate desuccinylase
MAATRREIDQRWPNVDATDLRFEESWPPYQLPDDATLSLALADAAEQVTRVRPRLKVAGPSNIGNYLATLGIPATAGYGLRCEGLHGTNERIQIASIPTTEATYHLAIRQLLGLDACR